MAVSVSMAVISLRRWRRRRWLIALGLHFLLLSNLLDGHEPLLAHLDSLRHVTDRGVF
jgi:hypothetical protein